MRGFSAVLVLALAACTGPFSEEVERATMAGPITEPVDIPAELEPPAWAPEPGHVYIFSAAGEIILDEGPGDYGGDYRGRYAALVLGVELWNTQGRPGASFRVVGGGPL